MLGRNRRNGVASGSTVAEEQVAAEDWVRGNDLAIVENVVGGNRRRRVWVSGNDSELEIVIVVSVLVMMMIVVVVGLSSEVIVLP